MGKSIHDQIAEILEDYGAEAQKIVDEAAKDAAEKTKQQLKATSPKSSRAGKHYANGWAVTLEKTSGGVRFIGAGVTAVVHNKTKPQLR